MKKALLTNALLIFGIISYSQITFNKLENYSGPVSSATNVKRIGDNYFIQYLYLDSSFSQGIGVLKTDEYGNIIKKIEFLDTAFWYGSISFRNIIATSDSFLIMAANRYYNQSLRKEKVEIWKFDTNLDTIWTKLIEHPDTAEANIQGAEKLVRISDLIQSLDGGYVLSIYYNRKCMDPTNSHNYRALLMKLDTTGNILWVNKNNEIFVQLVELEAASDSGFYSPAAISNLPYKLNKFDKLGNYLWSVNANAYPTQTHAIECCEYDSTSAIMATFYKINVQNGKYGITVFKINTNTKTVEWNKDFIVADVMVSQTLLQTMPMDIVVNKNGGIFIATSGRHTIYTPWQTVLYSGIVLKLNTNGDSLWTKYYNYNGNGIYDTELQGFMINDDGSFVGVGYGMLQTNPQQKLWFFKTDIGGYLGVEEKKEVFISGISVYPNPTSDNLEFSFKYKLNYYSELTIYNSIGQIINTYNIDKGVSSYKINTDNYQTGIYLYELKNKNKTIGTGKFVKD